MSKTAKINQIKTLLSKGEVQGEDIIWIQPKQCDEPILFKKIKNGRDKSLNIYVTSKDCAENVLKLFEQ